MRRIMLCFALAGLFSGRAGADALGSIDFPTTGSPDARAHFVRGVLALHSFFYDEALDEFRAATRAEPGFAMGYWGEAMALNHPLWAHQDTEAARAVLARIGDTSKLTPVERGFIGAVRALYGPGDKQARDAAYAEAMERLARDRPDDLEVQTFYALALLGAKRPDDASLGQRMRAGAIALEALARNPDHPGAAHYVIHAFDDADHAPLALPAARRYAQIASEAHHARHMPAHIFVHLGMWDAAQAACESAWAASEAWVARRGHPIAKKDYHSLDWLVLISDQQGKQKKAEAELARFAAAVRASRDPMVALFYVRTSVLYALRTGHAERMEKLLAPVHDLGVVAPAAAAAAEPGCHALSAADEPGARLELAVALARATAAAVRGDAARTGELLAGAAELRRRLAPSMGALVQYYGKVADLAIEGRLAAAQKRWSEAEDKLRGAIELQRKGPARQADPGGLAEETLLGDVLMSAGKVKDASAAYGEALRATPGDSLALLGAARAARKLGAGAEATAMYRKLAAQWKGADADFPDLKEVRSQAAGQ